MASKMTAIGLLYGGRSMILCPEAKHEQSPAADSRLPTFVVKGTAA
jgi:hypothetical protein